MRANVDSREGFEEYEPTPDDWREYEEWLDDTIFLEFDEM